MGGALLVIGDYPITVVREGLVEAPPWLTLRLHEQDPRLHFRFCPIDEVWYVDESSTTAEHVGYLDDSPLVHVRYDHRRPKFALPDWERLDYEVFGHIAARRLAAPGQAKDLFMADVRNLNRVRSERRRRRLEPNREKLHDLLAVDRHKGERIYVPGHRAVA